MGKGTFLSAIDIGTSKICSVLAYRRNGNSAEVENSMLQVVGVDISPSMGLDDGVVVNADETAQAVHEAISRAERVSGQRMGPAYVTVSGNHAVSANSRGVIAVGIGESTVSRRDIDRVLNCAYQIEIPEDRRILHIIPTAYVLDGEIVAREPVGLRGFKLEADVHVVAVDGASIEGLVRCMDKAGGSIKGLVWGALASAEAVLRPEEKESGVVLADIGAGTTDVAIFQGGNVVHTAVLPVGGNHITGDLSVVLEVSFEVAERIKLEYGNLLVQKDGGKEGKNGQGSAAGSTGESGGVPRRQVNEVIKARVEEIFRLILAQVLGLGKSRPMPASIVLTGGTAKLLGIEGVAEETFDLPARVGVPEGVYGLSDELNDPACACAAGLLLWGARYGGRQCEGEWHPHQGVAESLKRVASLVAPHRK